MNTFEIWNQYMKCYDFLNEVQSYRQNLQDIISALGVRKELHYLDAGSGTGNLCMELKALGAQVTGCDFSPNAIVQHRKKDPTATVIEASLEEPLPFHDQVFDGVCCASVLLTLSKSGCQLAVREFYRVLRAGGTLVVTSAAPNAQVGSLAAMHLAGLRKRYGLLGAGPKVIRSLPALLGVMHYSRQISQLPDWQGFHRFTETELTELLRQAGFVNVEVSRTYGGCFFLAQGDRTDSNPSVDMRT